MLAAIDDDSDSEPTSKPEKPERSALSAVAGNIQRVGKQRSVKEDAEVGQRENEDVAEGEESDESIVVPRGRLAARLNGEVSHTPGSSSVVDGEGNEDAYARIKKRFLEEQTRKTSESADVSESRGITPESRVSKRQRTSSIGCSHSSPTSTSTMRNRSGSPGIFLTPVAGSKRQSSLPPSANSDGSDADLPVNPQSNTLFLELVAKKRAEREAKEAVEDEKRAGKLARQRSFERALSQDASSGSGVSDDELAADRRLTQYSRPTRKASKKALEEMNSETQRMSRNMQLAHQAKTKKKISKQSLLDRFKFRTSVTPIAEAPQNPSSSTAASSAHASDLEEVHNNESPPTSPVAPDDSLIASANGVFGKQPIDTTKTTQLLEQGDEELPTMLEMVSQPIHKVDKGKGKARDYDEPDNAPRHIRDQNTAYKQRPIKVRLPESMLGGSEVDLDSGSDLEVLPVRKSKTSKLDVFDRLPVSKAQEGRSMRTLRALAHLNSPE